MCGPQRHRKAKPVQKHGRICAWLGYRCGQLNVCCHQLWSCTNPSQCRRSRSVRMSIGASSRISQPCCGKRIRLRRGRWIAHLGNRWATWLSCNPWSYAGSISAHGSWIASWWQPRCKSRPSWWCSQVSLYTLRTAALKLPLVQLKMTLPYVLFYEWTY